MPGRQLDHRQLQIVPPTRQRSPQEGSPVRELLWSFGVELVLMAIGWMVLRWMGWV